MAVDFSKGITVASGFSLQAKVPLDVRDVVATIADRDSLIGLNATYEGMFVYVQEDHTIYVRTASDPVEDDYSGCWRTVSTSAGSIAGGEAVLTTTDQTIGGTKTFTTAPKINSETITTKEYVDQQFVEKVTNEIGQSIQAHSDQLDKVAALATAGMIGRADDGSIINYTITATEGQLTASTDTSSGVTTIGMPNVGTAGTYFKVTTDAQGRVTAGENPTTVDGFGITDAIHLTGDQMTGLLKYTAETNNETSFDENTLVTKKYADSVALGFSFHVACKTGATTNIAGVYANGDDPEYPGVGATFTTSETTIGGIVVAAGDRVLLVGQTDQKQNGAYEVTSTDSQVVLTRVDDLDGKPHIAYNGASFLISEGSNKGQVWRVSNEGEITFGTDNIVFVQVFAPTALESGSGITVSGSTISLAAGNTVGVVGGKVEVLSGSDNSGKALIAGSNGTAASWKALDYSDIKSGIVPLANGGTGVANSDPNVITIGSITLTGTGTTNVNVPATGTLATLAGSETLTNKTVAATDVGGTALEVENGDIVGNAYMSGEQQVQPQLVGFVIDCGTY